MAVPEEDLVIKILCSSMCPGSCSKKNTDGQAFGLTERQNKAAIDVVSSN